MSAPDLLRTAAERLEAEAAVWDDTLNPGEVDALGVTYEAAEARAVAALLQAIDDAGPSIDDDEERIVQAALAVARVVAGDAP